MSDHPREWSREELQAEFAGSTVTARDTEGTAVPVAAELGLEVGIPIASTWDQQTRNVHEPDMPALAMQWYQALDKPGTVQELSVRRDDGGWKLVSLKLLDLRHQRDVGCVLIGSTELGECDPPEEHSRLRDSTTTVEDAAWYERPTWVLQEFDPMGLILSTEGDSEAMFGRSAAELAGTFVVQYLHPDDHAAAIEMWQSLLSELGSSRTIRQRIVRPDASERWIESTVLNRLDRARSGVLLSITHDITERRRHERVLHQRALTDSVTGLPNRFSIDHSLAELLERGPVTVAFLDLDGFKAVNDQMGHRVGDTFLEAIGHRLANAVEPRGSVGRWGGDEFVLFGPGHCDEDLSAAVEVAFADPISIGDDRWHPRCSVGITHGEPGDDPESLIGAADSEMYREKERRVG